jgi:hypothetical protein
MIDEILEDEYERAHGHIAPTPFGFNGHTPTLIPDDDVLTPPVPPTPVQSPPLPPRPVPPPLSPTHKPTRARPKTKRRCQQPRQTARRSPRSHKSAHALAPTTTTVYPDNFTDHFAMHGTAVNPDTGGIAEYKELSTCSDGALWQASNADEIGRMFQGLGPDSYMPEGTNTLFFINKIDIPRHKKPTYIRVVCANRPEKTNPKRVRWTAGGDKVEYTSNVTTQTAKCLFNSVISTPHGRFMTLDLKDFYLCSDLPGYEYVCIPIHLLPPEIIKLYKLQS